MLTLAVEPVPAGAVVVRVPARGVVGVVDDLAMLPVARVRGIVLHADAHLVPRAGRRARRSSRSSSLGSRASAATASRRIACDRCGRWALAGVAVLVVLWIPPVIDQFVHTPGNLVDVPRLLHGDPPRRPIGCRAGRRRCCCGSSTRGGCSTPSRRARRPAAAKSNGSLAPRRAVARGRGRRRRSSRGACGTGGARPRRGDRRRARARHRCRRRASSATVWFYLLLWAWGLTALMLFAIGWTVAAAVRAWSERIGPDRARRTHADRTTWIAAGARARAAARARFVRRQGRRRRRAGAAPEREPRRDRRADGRRPRAVGTGGDAGPVLPHVVPRRVDDRRGGLRPAQRARRASGSTSRRTRSTARGRRATT